MSFERVCTKCESTELRTANRPHASLFFRFLKTISLETVVCVDCGFVEDYVAPERREKLRRLGKRLVG